MRALVAVILVLVASACSGESSRSESDPQGAFPGAGVDCPTDEPSPITSELATDAFTSHGFTAEFDGDSCGLGEISGMLSNASSGRPDEVLEREGLVVCFLFVRPRGDNTAPDTTGDTGAAHAERRLANLTCDLYASRASVEDEAARLDNAFAQLRSSIR